MRKGILTMLLAVGLMLVGNYLLTSKVFAQCATGATCSPTCRASCQYTTCELESASNPISVVPTTLHSIINPNDTTCTSANLIQTVSQLPYTDGILARHGALPMVSDVRLELCCNQYLRC